ncbi:MAG: GNAT family N-acetyltransferase [Anaerolineae bacterium]
MIPVLQSLTYERKYRDDILSLIFYSRHTHTHLDWYKVGNWLDLDGNLIQLAFDRDELVGVMGFSENLNGSSWLRIAAVAQGYDPTQVMTFLWENTRLQLMQAQVQSASILVLSQWLPPHLPALGFRYQEDVVTMHRAQQSIPPAPPTAIILRNGYLEHVEAIMQVDHAAFAPPWQLSATDIRLSQRQAASCTIALLGGQIVGYEIATRHHTNGHLARLAVHPQVQGQRVGQALLHHLLTRFAQRGVKSMTVNTQLSNRRSQNLYVRYGFVRNGFDLSVWQADLTSSNDERLL